MRAPTDLGPRWREVTALEFYERVSRMGVATEWAETGPRYRSLWYTRPGRSSVAVSEWDPETGTKRYWLPT